MISINKNTLKIISSKQEIKMDITDRIKIITGVTSIHKRGSNTNSTRSL